jgi:hypothetical protein
VISGFAGLLRVMNVVFTMSAVGPFRPLSRTYLGSTETVEKGQITAIKVLGWPGVLPMPSCLHG